jgi:hypothetical protein
MPPCLKARNTRPLPHARAPLDGQPSGCSKLEVGRSHGAAPTSDEEFDLNVPNRDNSKKEDDNPPVRHAGGLPNMTATETQINDPSAFHMAKTEGPQSEANFFFKVLKDKGDKRECRYCM